MEMVLNNELLEFLNEYDASVGIYSIEKIDTEVASEIEESFNLDIIDYQENYFIFKDKTDYNVYHKIIDGTWKERIFTQKEYERLQYKNSEETEIYHNGINVCRINFFMDNENFKKALQFMRNNNMYTFDDSKILDFSIREGNNCLPYVPVKFVSEIEKHLNIKIKTDFDRHFLGLNELKELNVGQKVEITMYNVFGDSVVKGTVIQTNDDSVHVRPYRSKSKYYELNICSECTVKPIESFK
ncbi:hypothetical protein [Lysinibacillus sp. BPa_S21]|uniref:hypothetical protein n=1 Tax=Lysinibacillus sp. BPa_S21 TaxID=2932478 RepID=UPI002012482E|nr:hypothetical protein [Lysinibacillus sp. BPa_S21]MCL1696293.1 hypothetical protein [Lysinibacillus sp. BPa_S21]